jgi:hypothetical protein
MLETTWQAVNDMHGPNALPLHSSVPELPITLITD